MRFRASPNLEDRARLTQIKELIQHSRSHQNQSSHTGQHTQSTSKVVIHQASHSTTQMWFSRTRSTQCTRSRSRNDLWELRNETASSSKMCKLINTRSHLWLRLIFILIFVRPHYKAEVSEFDNKLNGFSISSGNCWTLKTSKKDETTPGPIYDTQYLNSCTEKV